MLKVLDLFSGIGGFSLGLEATGGFETVAFCEIEPYPIAVLKKHWPTVPVYEDVKTLTKERLDADGISVDVICGGFPCQDISLAGKGARLAGERSGLWFEFHRLIKEIKPKVIIAENVSALRSIGLDQVLRSLAEIGYDAEWHCIPASAVGAPHRRDRIWIVAYPTSERWGKTGEHRSEQSSEWAASCGAIVANTENNGSTQPSFKTDGTRSSKSTTSGTSNVANTNSEPNSSERGEYETVAAESFSWGDDGKRSDGNVTGSQSVPSAREFTCDVADTSFVGSSCGTSGEFGSLGKESGGEEGRWNQPSICTEACSSEMANTEIIVGDERHCGCISKENAEGGIRSEIGTSSCIGEYGWWDFEPNVGRVANGVPHRAHRLRALGNAVVPQIPQMIGNAILSWYSNQIQGDLCVCMQKRV